MFWVSYVQIVCSDKDILRDVAKGAGYLRSKWSGCHLVYGNGCPFILMQGIKDLAILLTGFLQNMPGCEEDVGYKVLQQVGQMNDIVVPLGCKFQWNSGGIPHYSGKFTNSDRNLITVRGGLL